MHWGLVELCVVGITVFFFTTFHSARTKNLVKISNILVNASQESN